MGWVTINHHGFLEQPWWHWDPLHSGRRSAPDPLRSDGYRCGISHLGRRRSSPHFRMWFTSEWWFHHKTDKYTINLTCFKQQTPPQNTCFKQQKLEPKTSFYPNFYLERIWLTGFSESWLETMNMAYMTIQSINDLYGLRGLAIRFAQGGHPRSSEVIRGHPKRREDLENHHAING